MLVMTNDGGWCWFDSRYFVNTLRFAPTFRISQAPSHGQLVIGPDSSKEKTRVAYRPGAGFTGSDTFAVVDATLNLERRVQVTVTP
jgi:hypothetical protein